MTPWSSKEAEIFFNLVNAVKLNYVQTNVPHPVNSWNEGDISTQWHERGCGKVPWILKCDNFLLHFEQKKFLFNLIFVTVIGSRPKPELCFLPGRLRWTLLPKECYGDSFSDRRSNTQPFNWEADTLSLNYRRSPKKVLFLLVVSRVKNEISSLSPPLEKPFRIPLEKSTYGSPWKKFFQCPWTWTEGKFFSTNSGFQKHVVLWSFLVKLLTFKIFKRLVNVHG